MPTTKHFNPNATCPVLAQGANKCPWGCTRSFVWCHYYKKGTCYFQKHTNYCSLGWHQGDNKSSNSDETQKSGAVRGKRSKSVSEESELRKETEAKRARNREVELHRGLTKRFAEIKRKERLVDLQINLTRLGFNQHQLPTATEVEQSLPNALRKLGPYEKSKQGNVEMLGDAFTAIMEIIRARREEEYLKDRPQEV